MLFDPATATSKDRKDLSYLLNSYSDLLLIGNSEESLKSEREVAQS